MSSMTQYLRTRFMPHIWCPGCGHGIVLSGLLRAIDALGLEKNDLVMVSGIGCSSRIQGYVDFHTLHTLHGRALAFATGIKFARPELKILVPMGDGDALAIGGNHFIHAARRNIDMTAIVMNNNIYGMTGGQYSPTTEPGKRATTAQDGTVDRPFDTVSIAEAAGATFIARTTTYHIHQMIQILKKAISHKGFSVVEVLTQCPTYYGRKNNVGEAADMMMWFKENTYKVGTKPPEEVGEMKAIGLFTEKEEPEYCERYDELIKEVSRHDM